MHMHHHHHDDPAPHDPFERAPDTAGEALNEALRSSFKILKLIIIIVGILYLCSGAVILDQNEKAVVMRFGKLQPDEQGPGGFYFNLPRPFDEIIRVPVAEKRTTTVLAQYVELKEGQESAREVRRSGPLDPQLDGSIMTGDRGLIHARWIVTYEIQDLVKFVRNIYDAEHSAAVDFIENAVVHAAVETIGQMNAVDVIRARIDDVRAGVLSRAREKLAELDSGISIASIDVETIPPVQTRFAFEQVTKAQNKKDEDIEEAKRTRLEILNATAGMGYAKIESMFNDYVTEDRAADSAAAATTMRAIEDAILDRNARRPLVTGLAGKILSNAYSYREQALEDIKADYLEFESYLPEFEHNPQLLVSRIWIKAQEDILTNERITKRYLPKGQKEIRLGIGPDPEELREQERRKYEAEEKTEGDFSNVKVDRIRGKPQLK